MSDYTCPDCGSDNLEIGNFPLRCLDCGWSYLNKYPCDVCGEKSVSAMSGGGNGNSQHRCKEHPFTQQERRDELRRFFIASFPDKQWPHMQTDELLDDALIIDNTWRGEP